MSKYFDGYLYDHLFLYKNELYELRNKNYMLKIFPDKNDPNTFIFLKHDIPGPVALPRNRDFLYHYLNWKGMSEILQSIEK